MNVTIGFQQNLNFVQFGGSMKAEKKRSETAKYFACILYPDDPHHQMILDYMRANDILYPNLVYILHDKDYDSRETLHDCLVSNDYEVLVLAKPHYHVFVETVKEITASGFCKRFVVDNRAYLHHVEIVRDPVAYIQYMIHADFESANDPYKYNYSVDALQGSVKWISKACERNNIASNWANLKAMYDFIRDNGLSRFLENAQELTPKQSEKLWDIYRCNQSLALKADQAYCLSYTGK